MEYPDMMSEYTTAPERYEVDEVQYVISLEPQEIAAGEATALDLHLQSVLEVPLDFTMKIQPQLSKEARKAGAEFRLSEAEPKITLAPAQVGRLVIPIATGVEMPPGSYSIQVEFKAKAQGRGQRIRPSQGKSRLKKGPIDDVVGLGLAAVLGADFKAKSNKKVTLTLQVTEPLIQADEVDLDRQFQSLWKPKDIENQNKAQREVNDRRVYILDELLQEALFVHMLAETQNRYEEVGVPLHLGEAIAAAKMITYTAEYFLRDAQMQDGLLVPIFERAIEQDLTTSEVFPVLRFAGYYHLTRLACAMSFGLVAQALKRQPWSVEERRAVIDLVATQVDIGQPLPPEFLYIPLLLGATQVADKVVMEGEDYRQSLGALREAKASRQQIFEEEEALMEVSEIFDQLMAAALA
jgi:hypothetical protein